MPKAKEVKADWFDSLDAELQQKTQEILHDVGEQTSKRAHLNKAFIEDFWKIWKRFAAMNVHITLEPSHEQWAIFEETYPEGAWRWRAGFNAATLTTIALTDRTQDQGRVGDSLKVNHYETEGKPRLKITFEYCEGEHYYKYSGWKRIWSTHILFDGGEDRLDIERVHTVFADVVKAWYESHLRRNRDILIRYLKKNFERVETTSV